MPIHPIVGLSEDYQVRGNKAGKQFILVKPDWDILHKIKTFDHFPRLQECEEAIKEYEKLLPT